MGKHETTQEAQQQLIVALLKEQAAAVHPDEIERFAHQVRRSQGVRHWWRRTMATPDRLAEMDIVRWIVLAQQAGDMDEAVWRGFLGGHFGRPSARADRPQQITSAGRLLCGFGSEPLWTWQHVSSDFTGFRTWLQQHRAELATLRFGNHRKYESAKPDNLFAVIESFFQWVVRWGGTPQASFTPVSGKTFDELYRSLGTIHRFGRTACFDTLCFLADLGLLDVTPGSCYLIGATGPLQGARQLWGMRPEAELERLANGLADCVNLPYEIIEDALCNWNK